MLPKNFLVFQLSKFSGRGARALLLLALEIVLFLPSSFSSRVDVGTKSADAYWRETGLDSSDLEQLLEPQACNQDKRHFLGCVNAISGMSERYEKILNLRGEFEALTPQAIEQRLTEKKELENWDKAYDAGTIPQISFFQIWKKMDHDWVQSKERSAVIAIGMNAIISVTKDPHSYILPMAFYEDVISRSDARPTHLGFLSKRVNGGAFVRKVFPTSPASVAGLKKGDRILEINGLEVASLPPSHYSELLKVRKNDRIRLRIERNENGKIAQKYVEIMKGEFSYPNVLSSSLEGKRNVGLITIHKFSRDTCKQVKENLIALKQEGLQGLILDLRDNPGGQVDEAACILSLFVAKGQLLFETRYLDPTRGPDRYRSEHEPIFKGPLSVLINGGSASAAEIVAGSLKDLGRASLVGERTFGKGTFQDGDIWRNNAKVAFFETEGLYYFPSGWTPQLVGLEPDSQISSLEDESLREDDLFYQPLRPADLWEGPQSLAWMSEDSCTGNSDHLSVDDPQIEKAWTMMSCDPTGGKGAANDRNGNL